MKTPNPRLRGPAIENKLKTHCKYGHPFDEENTAYYEGVRVCIKCRKKSKSSQQRKPVSKPLFGL